MPDTGAPLEGDWESGWESHRSAQAARLARLPFSDKLEWLEQAHRLVLQLARLRGDKPK